jgi:hypothetical protein
MSPTARGRLIARGGLLATGGAERIVTRRLMGVEAAEEGRSGDATREAGFAAGGVEKGPQEADERRGGRGRPEWRPASGEVAVGGRSSDRRTKRGRGRPDRWPAKPRGRLEQRPDGR